MSIISIRDMKTVDERETQKATKKTKKNKTKTKTKKSKGEQKLQ